jgi:hypothetical protein
MSERVERAQAWLQANAKVMAWSANADGVTFFAHLSDADLAAFAARTERGNDGE